MEAAASILPDGHLEGVLKRLRAVRRARGISQLAMAHRLGISQNAYSRLESGRREMSLIRFLELAQILRIPPEALLDGDGPKAKQHFGLILGAVVPNGAKPRVKRK